LANPSKGLKREGKKNQEARWGLGTSNETADPKRLTIMMTPKEKGNEKKKKKQGGEQRPGGVMFHNPQSKGEETLGGFQPTIKKAKGRPPGNSGNAIRSGGNQRESSNGRGPEDKNIKRLPTTWGRGLTTQGPLNLYKGKKKVRKREALGLS